VPAKQVIADFNNPEVERAVMSFPLRRPPIAGDIAPLVGALVELICTPRRCFLVLVALTERENVPDILLSTPSWLSRGMPIFIEILTLLGRILILTPTLQNHIPNLESNPCDLFIGTMSFKEPEVAAVLAMIIRRIPVDLPFLEILSQRGFVGVFFRAIKDAEHDYLTLVVRRCARNCEIMLTSDFPRVATFWMCPGDSDPLSN
jgi:hypothetical protein